MAIQFTPNLSDRLVQRMFDHWPSVSAKTFKRLTPSNLPSTSTHARYYIAILEAKEPRTFRNVLDAATP